jgi:hypothetical protein
MSNRRKFLKQAAVAGVLGSIPEVLLSSNISSFSSNNRNLPWQDDTTGKSSSIAPGKNVGAVLGRDTSGRPVLLVDGKPTPLNPGVILRGSISRGFTTQFASVFRKAGLEQLVLMMNLGNLESDQPHEQVTGQIPSFWTGYQQYKPDILNNQLGSILEVWPEVKLILWIIVDGYQRFTDNHPDAILRNDLGEAAVAQSHFLRFETYPAVTPLGPKEYYAVSFFSEAFRSEIGDMLEAFVKTVESSIAREAVIGYLIGGGQDAQQYAFAPPDGNLAVTPGNWGDYSQAARRAFPQWLQKRYKGNLAALNRDWGTALNSFYDAVPPPAKDLTGPALFHNPVSEVQAYQWKRFLTEGRSEFIIGMADRIRATAKRKVIIGTSGGDGGHRRDNTTTGLLLRAPSLDFYLHQAIYGVRIPPSTGGIGAVLDSYGVNGKLFLTDMDHRLWTGPVTGEIKLSATVSFNDDTVGRAHDMNMQRDMWRREYARLWIAGNYGAWQQSFARPADLDHPEILTEIRFLHEQMQKVVTRHATKTNLESPGGQAEVAFIFDETAVDFARGALSEFHFAGMGNQWAEAHASGVPIRFYYAQDLSDGLIPPAKLYVLQNLIHIDEIMAEQIRKLRKAGATVVVLQGTGMAQLRAGQNSFLDETLGIKLRLPDTSSSASGKQDRPESLGSHPLLSGDRWNPAVTSLGKDRLKEVEGITLTVEDSRASMLEYYPKSGKPAAAIVDETSGSKVAFIGSYSLSRAVISRLAAYAGAWRVAPPGNVIAADRQIMMIHPLKDGIIEVVPKVPSALRQMPPGDISSPKADSHKLELKAGSTYLFDII